MSSPQEGRSASRRFRLGRAERLNRIERIALLSLVAGLLLVDLFGFFASSQGTPTVDLLSVFTSLVFALYAWSPLVATIALGCVVSASFLADQASNTLFPAAIAAWLVMRLATTPLVMSYIAGLLLSCALLAYTSPDNEDINANIALMLLVATVAGGIGYALRMAYARGHRLENELAEQAEREREAVLAERRWIAGELHDSIAHHLTVVAMHVQLLDDESMRPSSQDAIRGAARKALSDLRFVIQMAEEAPSGTEVQSGDLAAAIEEATEEFEATGHPVALVGDPNDESIPRGAEIILARMVRESATNVLKYAGPGEVRFELDIEADSIRLQIRSPLPTAPRRDLPSTGTGLNRMGERVLGVRGEFSAGPVGDAWVVSARLPLE